MQNTKQQPGPDSTENAGIHATSALSPKSAVLLIVVISFIAMNLRSALICVGPVIESIRNSLNLSGTLAGLLMTLPILCFGFVAPLAPRLLRYRSAEQLVIMGIVILSIGLVLRSLFGTAGLFGGTFIAGAGIAIVMVVLPSIIKKYFPDRAGTVMGLYSTALCLGATAAAAFTVPIENIPGSNWQWALAFWVLPVLLCIVMWWPYSRRSGYNSAHSRNTRMPRLRSSWLAWQVSFFMGIQSGIAYSVFGWMPVILVDRGMTPLTAGFALSLTLGIQLVTTLSAPWLATRGKNQRLVILIMLAMTLFGLMTTLYAPISGIWVWASVLGLGLGGVFSIAMALLVLRSPSAQIAASLSGMAQGVGYTVAATGPVLVGLAHELTGNWHGVAVLFIIMVVSSGVFGMGAGRSLYVQAK
jgi:CP family cyanate transporter-like MFS transporter